MKREKGCNGSASVGSVEPPSTLEKHLYLRVFRDASLVFILPDEVFPRDLEEAEVIVSGLVEVLSELTQAGARILLLVQVPERYGSHLREIMGQSMAAMRTRFLPVTGWQSLLMNHCRASDAVLVGLCSDATEEAFHSRLVEYAGVLGFSRMIVLNALGRIQRQDGKPISFVLADGIRKLLIDLPEMPEETLRTLSLVESLLQQGVESVSLCRIRDLPQELFTYQGHGTFFSRRHQCDLRRLVWRDYPQAVSIIGQGEREGFLLPRSEHDLAPILAEGYGAFVSGSVMAGVCGLLTSPYLDENLGEIVSLYTVTRFKGEGVGRRMIQGLKQEAARQELNGLFACTTHERVVAFFQREGFRIVSHDRIPQAKWTHYDEARKRSVVGLVWSINA
ncbi:MAG: GNAT family N-acetyltransferase [Magnetococcales bacterium]|nr:GNAT family N-acetyltransferase [Magnetococcales bacterium]